MDEKERELNGMRNESVPGVVLFMLLVFSICPRAATQQQARQSSKQTRPAITLMYVWNENVEMV